MNMNEPFDITTKPLTGITTNMAFHRYLVTDAYDPIRIYTRTIVLYTTMQFNIHRLYEIIRVTDADGNVILTENDPVYRAQGQKRKGAAAAAYCNDVVNVDKVRKKPDKRKKGQNSTSTTTTSDAPNDHIPFVARIAKVSLNTNSRGSVTWRRETVPFQHTLCIDIVTSDNLHPNLKISASGTVHLTGCPDAQTAIETFKMVWDMHEENTDAMWCVQDITPLVICDIVMTNTNFSIGHRISRSRLDEHIQKNHGMISSFDPNVPDSSVRIKLRRYIEQETRLLAWNPMMKTHHQNIDRPPDDDNEWYCPILRSDSRRWGTVPLEILLNIISPAGRRRFLRSRKRTTWLVFRSGAVIQVSRWCDVMLEDNILFRNIIQSIGPFINEAN